MKISNADELKVCACDRDKIIGLYTVSLVTALLIILYINVHERDKYK